VVVQEIVVVLLVQVTLQTHLLVKEIMEEQVIKMYHFILPQEVVELVLLEETQQRVFLVLEELEQIHQ
jgi:hypothetical protein